MFAVRYFPDIRPPLYPFIQPHIFQSTWPHFCLLFVLKLSGIPFCIHSDLKQIKVFLPLCIRGYLEARNWPRGGPLSLR